MSAAEVELLTELYQRPTFEEVAAALHPEAELHQAGPVPDADDYHGRDDFVRGVRRWHEEWETFHYLVEDATDLGQRVLLRVRVSGQARASGVVLELTAFHLWAFREGMPWRCEVFLDEERALAAAAPPG